MISGSPQQSIGYPKSKATSKNVRETLEMLEMDFSDFDKYKAYRNSRDGSKEGTTSL